MPGEKSLPGQTVLPTFPGGEKKSSHIQGGTKSLGSTPLRLRAKTGMHSTLRPCCSMLSIFMSLSSQWTPVFCCLSWRDDELRTVTACSSTDAVSLGLFHVHLLTAWFLCLSSEKRGKWINLLGNMDCFLQQPRERGIWDGRKLSHVSKSPWITQTMTWKTPFFGV